MSKISTSSTSNPLSSADLLESLETFSPTSTLISSTSPWPNEVPSWETLVLLRSPEGNEPHASSKKLPPLPKKRWFEVFRKDVEEGELNNRREDDEVLIRMIGFLATAPYNEWAAVLEVCALAGASEHNAKIAANAFRQELKYGEPSTQLGTARLLALMFRNSPEIFIRQTATRQFLNSLEDILSSSQTNPVVKDRLRDVVGDAAFSNHGNEYRELWKRVKPPCAPDEGVPLDMNQLMPPEVSDSISRGGNHPATDREERDGRRGGDRVVDKIIPYEEDMRRLFQECKIGLGNASLLSVALRTVRPKDLNKTAIIQEFYSKCRQSHQLIDAQIEWAYAGVEKIRIERNKKRADAQIDSATLSSTEEMGSSIEEQLLEALLAANTNLVEAIQEYVDLQKVYLESVAEIRFSNRSEYRELGKSVGPLEVPDSLTRGDHPATDTEERDGRRESDRVVNKIVPLQEDVRRLFQECKIGRGNASFLSLVLDTVQPDESKKMTIVQEIYVKCRKSHELINAQIEWAYAGVERTRRERKRKTADAHIDSGASSTTEEVELSVEEQLLAALLAANTNLEEAIKEYEEMQRVYHESVTEKKRF